MAAAMLCAAKPTARASDKAIRGRWLYSGVLMVVVPFPLLLVMALGTTLLSFVILDETP